MDLFMSIAVLLGLAALFSFINERFLRLQATIGLMLLALGMTVVLFVLKAAGIAELTGWESSLVGQLDLGQTLLTGVLCFMLFSGSAGVRVKNLARYKWTIATLAIGATILACGMIGLVLAWGLPRLGLEFSFGYAIVFGALISPTDPIAALAILKSVGLPKPLETIINGESLFNDGVGVVLFTIGLAIAGGDQQPTVTDAVVLFVREVLGGIGLGLLASAVMHFMLMRTTEYGTQLLITLSAVTLGYGLAEKIEVSGPIAMVVAGLVVGNFTIPKLAEKQSQPLTTFWHGMDETLNALLFVMIGLEIGVLHRVPGPSFALVAAIAIVTCLVARAISVYIPILGLTRTGALKADAVGLTKLLTWGGLRGGLALALALSLPDAPEKALIVNMTYVVVAFSILIQGSTIGRLFKPHFLNGLIRSD